MASLNILFLTAHLPVLGLHGGGARMFHNLRILAERHSVTLISFIEDQKESEKLSEIEGLGVRVKTVLRRPLPARDFLLAKPREHWEYASGDMAALVKETMSKGQFNVVQAEYVQMGQHVPQGASYFKILTEHEVQFANSRDELQAESRLPAKISKFYQWMTQFNYEVRVCRRFNRVVCMTEQDVDRLGAYVPASKLKWIPIGVDSNYFRPQSSRPDPGLTPKVLFVGNYRHPPNREAVLFFMREVMPRLQARHLNVEFNITGANTGLFDRSSVDACAPARILGYLPDVRTAYNDADIFVAPLHSGNGMRVKLLEALSMGKAVVATRLAVAGFSITPEEHLLLAETPQDFAFQVERLLSEPSLRARLGENARKLIKENYDWDVLRSQFLELVEDQDG